MIVLTNLKKVISDTNKNLENRVYKIATTVGIIVFALGVFSTYIYAGSIKSEKSGEMNSYQEDQADYVEGYIQTKLATYEELIIAGAAIHKTHNNVTKSDWRNIYYNLRIPERAPELLGYGYIEYVAHEDLTSFIENSKQTLNTDYTVTPASDRESHAPIKYIEPLNDINALSLGYDMYTELNRYDAMMIAKDTGEPTLSGPIVAIQDQRNPESVQAQGLVMYYPVYEEDRANIGDVKTLVGYSYIIFRVEDIMQKLNLDMADTISKLYLKDMGQDGGKLIYYKDSDVDNDDPESSNYYERSLNVLSRKWNIGLVVKQPDLSNTVNPTRVFVSGVFVSFLLGSLLFLILLKRASDINRNHSISLQKSKDELLALASHQLRTPATGVRQYVGMLVEGYFGSLNNDQFSIAKKAYDTNERQLEIIDQLLYVAKADAGQLLVSIAKVDIAKIVQDVMAGYDNVAAGKNIKIFYKGKKKLLCSGDIRYITMIIENLLSNAIKYSYPGTVVRLELNKVDSNVVFKVIDQGIGIPENYRDKLFQKFSRIDSPLSRSEGGTGLGLFLAKKLAESHGGDVVAESNGTTGSTFILMLPLRSDKNNNVVQLTA